MHAVLHMSELVYGEAQQPPPPSNHLQGREFPALCPIFVAIAVETNTKTTQEISAMLCGQVNLSSLPACDASGHGIFRVIPAFCGMPVTQNAEITRKSPNTVLLPPLPHCQVLPMLLQWCKIRI